jgi:hypothetical protein
MCHYAIGRSNKLVASNNLVGAINHLVSQVSQICCTIELKDCWCYMCPILVLDLLTLSLKHSCN